MNEQTPATLVPVSPKPAPATEPPAAPAGGVTCPSGVRRGKDPEADRPTGSQSFIKRLGNYEVRSLIGRGGMGRVFKGFDVELQRPVAIKELAPELVYEAHLIDRFKNEAQLVARLNHPNVCHVYHFGQDPDTKVPYFVMEFVDGRDLEATVKEKGPLRVRQAVDVIRQAAEGLRVAYKEKLIHRDVKPSNLLLAPDGTVKVTDFGLAKALEGGKGLTGKDSILGTPWYLSPEAAQGIDLDHRSDIYSLGATFYHLLAGKVPFDGPTPLSIINKHVNEQIPDVGALRADVPRQVRDIVTRMLAKRREERYQGYDQIVGDLEAVASLLASEAGAGAPEGAATRAAWEAAPVDDGRLRIPLGAGVAVAAALVLVGAVGHGGGLASLGRLFSSVPRPVEGQPYVNSLGQTLAWAPAGTFAMGSTTAEAGHHASESPVHQVTIGEGFWIGTHEVTQTEWATVMGENPSHFKGPRRPVDGVTWAQALAYARRLTARERSEGRLSAGLAYGLPTEAQWEYACRAGTAGALWTGPMTVGPDGKVSPELATLAWYAGSGERSPEDWDVLKWPGAEYPNIWEGTRPVGQKKANPWGLYDVLGNVGEWCVDWWTWEYKGAPADGSARFEPRESFRVFRGGAWHLDAASVRPASRGRGFPDEKERCGLRLALRRVAELPDPLLVAIDGLPSGPPKEGQKFRNGLGMGMAWIPAGTFAMGSTTDAFGSGSSERPQHQVTIGQGFWAGMTEVTQDEYERLMKANPSELKGPRRPVTNVTLDEAGSFCRELTGQERRAGRLAEGWTYTVPSGAQWEYACRAGTTGAHYEGAPKAGEEERCPSLDPLAWWQGNALQDPIVWDALQYPDERYPDLWKGPKPVGFRKPNSWGLFDTLGNVGEWCQDTATGDYVGAPTDGSAWKHDGWGNVNVRGGAWPWDATGCRAATRSGLPPRCAEPFVGFRVVLLRK